MTQDDPEDTFSDIDLLMSLDDPALYTTQDLDRIIAYQRKMRRQREAGVKTRKPKDEAPSKLDISALMNKIQPVTAPIKRRV